MKFDIRDISKVIKIIRNSLGMGLKVAGMALLLFKHEVVVIVIHIVIHTCWTFDELTEILNHLVAECDTFKLMLLVLVGINLA